MKKEEKGLYIHKFNSADKTRLRTPCSFHTLRNLSSVQRHLIVSFRHGSQRGPGAAASFLLVYTEVRKADRPVMAAIWSPLLKDKQEPKCYVCRTTTITNFCWSHISPWIYHQDKALQSHSSSIIYYVTSPIHSCTVTLCHAPEPR